MEKIIISNQVKHIKLHKQISISKGINVFYGPNGVGKSTITNYIKDKITEKKEKGSDNTAMVISKHTDQSSFIKKKKIIKISPSIDDLRVKQDRLEELNKFSDFKKKDNITPGEYKKIFKEIPFEGVDQIEGVDYPYYNGFDYKVIMDKYDEVSQLKLRIVDNMDIKNSLRELHDKLNFLDLSINDSDDIIECPLCGSKEVESIETLKSMIESSEKKDCELNNKLDETIEVMRATDLKSLKNLKDVFKLSKGQIRTIVHSLNSALSLDEVMSSHNEIKNLTEEIAHIKNKQKKWIDIFKENGNFIENEIKEFDSDLIKECEFDDLEIKITLSREISTLSQGEFNMLLHIIKLIEFKLDPDSKWLIIDDPFSSNDASKMPIISTYINNVIKEDNSEGVVIFTHSQDFYDCLKTKVHYRVEDYEQNLSFRLLDKKEKKLISFNDNPKKKSMIYNAYKSKEYNEFAKNFIKRDRLVQVGEKLTPELNDLLHTDKKTDDLKEVLKARNLEELPVNGIKGSTDLIIWKMMKASIIRLSLECLLNEYMHIQGNTTAKRVGKKIRELDSTDEAFKRELYSMAGLSNNMIHGFGTSTSFSSALSTTIDELNRKEEKIKLWIQEKIWK